MLGKKVVRRKIGVLFMSKLQPNRILIVPNYLVIHEEGEKNLKNRSFFFEVAYLINNGKLGGQVKLHNCV